MIYQLWSFLAVVSTSETNFIANLVQTFDNIYHYNNLVVLRGVSFDSGQFDELFVKLSEGTIIPHIIGSQTNRFDLQYVINRVSLAVIFADDENDEILTSILTSLRGRRTNHVIFVLNNPRNLTSFFQWAWRKQFTKPLVVSGTNLFSINPYPRLQVVDVTSSKPELRFPKYNMNFKGYKIRSPIQMDVPRVFWYEGKEKTRDLSGYGGRVIRHFTRFVNIRLELYRDDSSIYLQSDPILNLLETGVIELSIHPFMVFNRSVFGASYPIESVTYCLMQPVGPPISKYVYIILPFSGGVWMWIGVTSLFFTIVLSQLPLEEDRPFDIGKAALITISVIQNLPTPVRMFNTFNSLRIVYLQLFLFGFILSNIYLALMASYLTSDVYAVQDDTLEAVIHRQQTIMVPAHDMDLITTYNNLPVEFYKLFVNADTDNFTQYRNSLNPAYSYPITSDRWKFVSMQQMFMKRKPFRVSANVCFANFPLQFAMQYDSHLNRPLSYFILAAQESGLYAFWRSSAFRRALSMGYVRYMVDDVNVVEPLSTRFLTYIMFVWVGGLMAGVVVFLIELNTTKLYRMMVTLRRLFIKRR